MKLKLITDTAEKICGVVRANGESSVVKGDVKAQLGGLVGRLAELGGTVTAGHEDYAGVLQADAAKAISHSEDCRQHIFDSLSTKFLSQNSETEKPAQPADSVTLQSIGPRPGTFIHSRQAMDINLELTYVLNSADQAFLAIYLEEVEGSDAGCGGRQHRTRSAVTLPVTRGEHFISARVNWPGSSGSSFVAAGANLWKNVDGHVGKIIVSFGLFPEVCYHLGP